MTSWSAPTPKLVSEAIALMGHAHAYRHFFEKLNNPMWIDPLHKKDFFKTPRNKIEDKTAKTVNYPSWPESEYLARMAHVKESNKGLIEQITLDIPDVDNFRLYEDLSIIATGLEIASSEKVAKKIIKWLKKNRKSAEARFFSFDQLAIYLIKGNAKNTAFELLSEIYRIHSKTTEIGDEKPFQWREAQSPLGTHEYEEGISKLVNPLVEFGGLAGINFLSKLLSNAMFESSSDEQKCAKDDTSFIWRPRIDSSKAHVNSIRDTLVSAVRDAGKLGLTKGLVKSEELFKSLTIQPWPIHQRLGWFLLRFAKTDPAYIGIILDSEKYFFDDKIQYEYQKILSLEFDSLSNSIKTKILNWIESGPRRNPYDSTTEKESHQSYIGRWKTKKYSAIKNSIPERESKILVDLENKYGVQQLEGCPIDTPVIWHGPTSPKSKSDLLAMNADDILNFLQSWVPSNERLSGSVEGLSRVLNEVVVESASKLLPIFESLATVDSSYFRAATHGFSAVLEGDFRADWNLILSAIEIYMKRGYPNQDTNPREFDEVTWTRQRIASLLGTGFNSEKNTIPINLQSKIWKVMAELLEDSNPTPAYETNFGGSNQDPHTMSINTTRGEAFHSLIKYAFWKRKLGGNSSDTTFEKMPEVQTVLEKHLNDSHDPSVAVRSVYGFWFPWLVALDKKWSNALSHKIFGEEKTRSPTQIAAWKSYLYWQGPYDDVLKIVRSQYAFDCTYTSSIQTDDKDAVEMMSKLGEHLVAYYARKQIELNDPLITSFFENANVEIRARVISHIGRILEREKDLPKEILARLKLLFDWRMEKTYSLPISAKAEELHEFSWWFCSGQLDAKWSLKTLVTVLEIVPEVEMRPDVADRIEAMFDSDPELCLSAIQKIIEGDKKGWGIYSMRPQFKRILESGLKSSNSQVQKRSNDITNLLGIRGYMEFGELLKFKKN